MLACNGTTSDEGGYAQAARTLSSGRTIGVQSSDGAQVVTERVAVGTDPRVDELADALASVCTATITARFSAVTGTHACDLSNRVRAQQEHLCMGHQWMTLASTLRPVDVFLDGHTEEREPLDIGEGRSDREDDSNARGLSFTVPIPDSDSRATMQILAMEAFRAGAIEGADILDPTVCADGVLTQRVPGGRVDGIDGISVETEDEVTVAFVVTSATAEAMSSMVEAAESAEEAILAEADARRATDRDHGRANALAWHGLHNSRAEAFGLWTGVPEPRCHICHLGDGEELICPDSCYREGRLIPECEVQATPCDEDPEPPPVQCAQCYYPGGNDVCPYPGCRDAAGNLLPNQDCVGPVDCPPPPDDDPDDEPEEIPPPTCDDVPPNLVAAVQVLRAVRVDPRTGVGRSTDAFLTDIRDAFLEDFPTAFAESSGDTPETWLRRHTGIDAAEYVQAASILRREARTLGRSIERVTDPTRRVPRVSGVDESLVAPDPMFIFAEHSGVARFDDAVSALEEHTRRIGTSRHRVSGSDLNIPSRSYAERGVLQAADFVAAKLRAALGRDDVSAGRDGSRGSTSSMAATALGYARTLVNARVKVDIGRAAEKGGIDNVRLRIFGEEVESESYELWWGHDGLQCALTGTASGRGCDEDAFRVKTRRSVGSDADSGFDASYVEMVVQPSDLPQAYRAEAIPAAGRLYVTRRSGQNRESVVGFGIQPGENTGAYSRSILIPVSRQGVARAASVLIANPLDCDRPERCCGNVDCDLRVPLESEISEAATGEDMIESSFRYYISIAKEAAARADALGEEVVLTGLELDRRAESAREELEALCGGVVNVSSLTPTPCANDGQCNGGSCVEGSCIFGPDTAGLERCIGAGELVAASMGDRPACYFVSEGIPCHCDVGEDCPVCPVAVSDESDCALNLFPGAPDDATVDVTALALGFSVSDYDGQATFDCNDLVQIRAGNASDGNATIQDIVNAPWFNETTFAEMAHYVGYDPELMAFGYTNRGGSPWFGTGTLQNGPNADEVFPCAPHPLAEGTGGLCSNHPQNGRPLLCGVDGSCSDVRARAAWSARLQWALHTMGLLGHTTNPGLYTISRTVAADRDDPDDDYFALLASCTGDPTGDVEHIGEDGGVGCVRYGSISMGCVDHPNNGIDCLLGTPWRRWEIENYAGVAPTPAWLTSQIEAAGAGVSDSMIVHRAGDTESFTTVDNLAAAEFAGSCLLLNDTLAFGISQLDPSEAFVGELLEATNGELCPTMSHVAKFHQPGLFGPATQQRIFRTNSTGYLYEALYNADNPFFHDNPDDQLFSAPYLLFDGSDNDPIGVRIGEALDAMEMACLAAHEQQEGGCLNVLAVPDVNTLDDLGVLAGLMSCGADEIERSLERMVLFDMPSTVAEDVAAGNIDPTFPIYRGSYGQSVADLRGSFESVIMATRHVATTLRDFGADLRLAETQIEQLNIELELLELQGNALNAEPSFLERLGEVAKCGKAVFDAASSFQSFGVGSVGKVVNAAQTCGSLAQDVSNAAALQQIALQEEALGLQQTETLIQITLNLGQRIDALATSASELAATYSHINGILAQLDQQRNAAGRAAAKVLLLDVDEVGREYNVNTVMRRRHNTARVRYEEARESAIRLAYLARRATEQRFAVDLSTLDTEIYGTGEAPSAWADELCTAQGIDYDRIRDFEDDDDYAEAFLGDWLEKLETFADTYQVNFPLQNDNDTTVISLRDDIFRQRVDCDLEGWNQLLWSSDPAHAYHPDTGGWAAEFMNEGYGLLASPLAESPFGESVGALEPEQASALGGAAAVTLAYTPPGFEAEEGVTPELPWWSQGVSLDDGQYLLSWYERVAMAACESVDTPAESALRVAVLASDGLDLTLMDPVPLDAQPWEHDCWRRYFVTIDNPTDQDVRVRLRPRVDPTPALESVDFAAPQLEAVVDEMSEPRSFFSTDEDWSWPAASCEDTQGDQFRADNWHYVCEPICPDGTLSCSPEELDHLTSEALPHRCFWETTFAMSLEDLENRTLLPEGGVALGSFNYRTRRFAVNVVGTAVRDCEASDWPTTCNASAFLPTSLRHDGPYEVRSYDGSTYLAPIFDGEAHGKALTAERYITNPLSTADQSLLASYWRTAFAGRPLAGRYRLRIEDVPSLQWERVRDVQLVVDYGFWTRFD